MQLTEIGYISKTKGIKGELVLKTEQLFELEDLKVIFIDEQGNKAPHFIEEIRVINSGIQFKLENIGSVELARRLVGKKVFVEENIIEIQEEDWLLDYEVIDHRFGSLGKVLETEDNGAQMLLHLNYKDKQIILPYVEEFIMEVNEETKKIMYNAPEGLIDIYLSEIKEQ